MFVSVCVCVCGCGCTPLCFILLQDMMKEEYILKLYFSELHRSFHSIPSPAEQSSDEELESVPAETPRKPSVLESPRPATPVQRAPAHHLQTSPPVSMLKVSRLSPQLNRALVFKVLECYKVYTVLEC